jgi:hypothetical protein
LDAVRHASNELFVSCKRDFVAVVDATLRKMTGKIPLPGVIEVRVVIAHR